MTDKPQTMQELGEEFMMYVGMCITEWSRVEEEVFNICRDILKVGQEYMAIIYYRTPTLASRLELADELVATIIPKKPESGKHTDIDALAWKRVFDAVKDAFSIRNQLAHSPVSPVMTLEDGTWLKDVAKSNVRYRFESYPHPQEKARARTNKTALVLTDLQNHLALVASLHHELGMFRLRSLATRLAKL